MLYSGSSGLNTVNAPVRMHDGQSREAFGIVELSEAKNVYIDDSMMIRRRMGTVRVVDGNFHSAFCDDGDCFVVQDRTDDAAIMRVIPDSKNSVTVEGVRSGLTKSVRMSWAEINGDTFYSNGIENGFIRNGQSYPWPIGQYVGADTDKQFGQAPIGQHIAFKPGGIIFIARDNVLYANHKPFEFGLFNLKSGFVAFSSRILMVCPVEAGVFVSDEQAIWFLRGTNVFNFSQEKVADYPAIEWSLANEVLTSPDMGMEESVKIRLVTSVHGICALSNDGSLINLTDKKIKLGSQYSSGASVICSRHKACNNQFITTLFM
jgi:hypothetical protein